ncbi:hypothetical protein ACIRQH_34765 [Streptomyces sp. NPDC102279]|uniref:hypothetical protein n=1 Tax=Streptomyces sp. NPDC102279 TaxID=3366153 RepID=UPI0037FBB405
MIATGNDEFSEQLAERIGQFIVAADAGSARSQQRTIGPSEVGEPCERQLTYKILDWPESNTDRDPIAAIIGTGFHLWMAEKFEARQAPLADGQPRYRIEERVTVRDGYTDAARLTGSSDLYDRLARLNWDWKLVGVSSLDKYRRQGPGQKYRVQAHLYGLGQENAGHTPERVVVAFVARHHELKVHVWSEPYDRTVAEAALARLDRIRDRAQALELDLHPERWNQIPIPEKPNCRFCPYVKPGSTDLSQGCPGGSNASAGASLEALIA